jgi:hypothetical protein
VQCQQATAMCQAGNLVKSRAHTGSHHFARSLLLPEVFSRCGATRQTGQAVKMQGRTHSLLNTCKAHCTRPTTATYSWFGNTRGEHTRGCDQSTLARGLPAICGTNPCHGLDTLQTTCIILHGSTTMSKANGALRACPPPACCASPMTPPAGGALPIPVVGLE